MSSTRIQYPSSFPTVPASLSAGGHGMQDYYATQDTQRTVPHTLQNITPYLGLRARLSQVWVNRWTVLLLLVLARTLIAITGVNNDLATAQTQVTSACTCQEAIGSAMASMPYYLSTGVNDLAASGVEKAVNGLMSMLLLTVTGVEEIVAFYINWVIATYVCLITLAISGSLHVAIQVAEDVASSLNSTLKSIENSLESDISTFENDFNSFMKGLSSIPTLLTGKAISAPTLNINSTVAALSNIQLPLGIDEGLTKLNNSIPTFAQVQNFTNNAIQTPFEDVKGLINEKIGTFVFDKSLLPVPQKQVLTFCSKNDTVANFFDEVAAVIDTDRKIFLAIIIVAAVLACIPMAYRDIMRWRTMQHRAVIVTDRSIDPLDAIYIASRPYTATAGMKLGDKFNNKRMQILARWVVAYATSPAALFILSLAVAGLFSCLCQYILLKSLEKEVPILVNELDNFADVVVNSLKNSSGQWADSANKVITSMNNDVNSDVLSWVNTTTNAINNTLNTFVDDMVSVLNDTFGGTVLYTPILDVINCTVGLKVAAFQQGLSWVSDHAHVDFPLFPPDIFSAGAAASIASNNTNSSASFMSSPGSDASAGASAFTGPVLTVQSHLQDAVETEVQISLTVLGIYILIVLLGLFRACWLACKRDQTRGEGGPSNEGDVPLELQQPQYAAPAYEPPTSIGRPDAAMQQLSAFREPMDERSASRDNDSEEEWRQGTKSGFAGERQTMGRVDKGTDVRASEYVDLVGDYKF